MNTVLFIGGHSGDEAVMAGTIAAGLKRTGKKAVFLSLTNGDGGHPFLPKTEYAKQKNAEARAAAEILGVECILLPNGSNCIDVSQKAERELAEVLLSVRPDTVITHWHNSMHRDHTAAYYVTRNAIRLASKEADFQPPRVFYGDNWEDAEGYRPSRYVIAEPEDEELWLKACRCFEFFRGSFYDFDYEGFYKALHRVRGIIARRELPGSSGIAVALMEDGPTSYDTACLTIT